MGPRPKTANRPPLWAPYVLAPGQRFAAAATEGKGEGEEPTGKDERKVFFLIREHQVEKLYYICLAAALMALPPMPSVAATSVPHFPLVAPPHRREQEGRGATIQAGNHEGCGRGGEESVERRRRKKKEEKYVPGEKEAADEGGGRRRDDEESREDEVKEKKKKERNKRKKERKTEARANKTP